MKIIHTLEDFYRHKLNWMPENLQKEIGHFNVFRLDDFVGPDAKNLPFSRKDFYKITLIKGQVRVYYADQCVDVESCALLFSNPQVPYTCEYPDGDQSGYFCIFTESFFNQFGHIRDYPIFQPGGTPLLFPDEQQAEQISRIFQRMVDEIASDYTYKYDVLRNLVLELVHSGLKMQPMTGRQYTSANGAVRVATLFTELLERQFPIESPHQSMKLRAPADFATHLSVHVNHLNRSLKEITGKTTSQLITERVLQEASTLLRHTDWNISEIAWCLGFEESPHFINFFKKNTRLTPSSFRRQNNI